MLSKSALNLRPPRNKITIQLILIIIIIIIIIVVIIIIMLLADYLSRTRLFCFPRLNILQVIILSTSEPPQKRAASFQAVSFI